MCRHIWGDCVLYGAHGGWQRHPRDQDIPQRHPRQRHALRPDCHPRMTTAPVIPSSDGCKINSICAGWECAVQPLCSENYSITWCSTAVDSHEISYFAILLAAERPHFRAGRRPVLVHGCEIYCWRAGLLSLRTLVFKLIGVTCSMAGGLIAGKEGPFIHTGAAWTFLPVVSCFLLFSASFFFFIVLRVGRTC